MDENEKTLIQAVVHEAAAPLVGPITDLVGIAGGDWLKAVRRRRNERRPSNQRETLEAAAKVLEARGVKPDPDTGPEKIAVILEAAQDRSEQHLKDMFGRLLAAAVDPKRAGTYRNEFVNTVKQFDWLDAAVLMLLYEAGGNYAEGQPVAFASRFNVKPDQVELSLINLIRLNCARDTTNGVNIAQNVTAVRNVVLTTLGRELARVVHD